MYSKQNGSSKPWPTLTVYSWVGPNPHLGPHTQSSSSIDALHCDDTREK